MNETEILKNTKRDLLHRYYPDEYPNNSCESKCCVIRAKLNNGLCCIVDLLIGPRLFLFGPKFLDRFPDSFSKCGLDALRSFKSAGHDADRLAADAEFPGDIAIGYMLLKHEKFEFKIDHGLFTGDR